ncbi:multidrug resistance fnx1 [Fusarium subglutinans]|uniref:Multidrug resistance fnx1 n=1 Tax=Gibberella subglutinans TaxID=42677 RepID=A0A8H5KUF5_GIBSU|nr:multidrug resistance fnx1 [Fusarium subglutinans]KAF5580107.1 multidrug resistance fnx1 [Fusarium subglutinans]
MVEETADNSNIKHYLPSKSSWCSCTIVTTLTHTIMSDLESSLVVSWLGASYLIATALVQPLCAFALGNFTCSIAESLAFLVVGRALSGIGGGILTIMATIVLTDVTRTEARGLWQGINNIVFGFGHGSGGLFGGLVAHRWSWRVAFMSLSVPALLIMLGATLLPEPISRHNQIADNASAAEESTATGNEDVPLLPKLNSSGRKVDTMGTILLSLGLGSLLASSQQLEFGSSNLDLRLVAFGFVISFIMLTAFSYHSVFMTKDALLPLGLLTKSPSVGYSCLVTFLSQFGFTISEFYLPYYLSLQEHTKMEVVGWCLVPLSVGAAAGSFLAGFLTSRSNTSHLLLGSSAVAFIGTLGSPYSYGGLDLGALLLPV